MDETINKVLKALNLLNVSGERNLDLLLFSIQELKALLGTNGEVK